MEVTKDVQVVGDIIKLVGLRNISGGEGEANNQREREPVVGGSEQEVVVAIHWSDEPPRSYHVIDGLVTSLVMPSSRKEVDILYRPK